MKNTTVGLIKSYDSQWVKFYSATATQDNQTLTAQGGESVTQEISISGKISTGLEVEVLKVINIKAAEIGITANYSESTTVIKLGGTQKTVNKGDTVEFYSCVTTDEWSVNIDGENEIVKLTRGYKYGFVVFDSGMHIIEDDNGIYKPNESYTATNTPIPTYTPTPSYTPTTTPEPTITLTPSHTPTPIVDNTNSNEPTPIVDNTNSNENAAINAIPLNQLITNLSNNIVFEKENVTDSYGKSHSEVCTFDTSYNASFTYNLDGKGYNFKGDIFIPATAGSGALVNFAIFVDGDVKYSIVNFNKQMDVQSFDVDIQNAKTLTVKTSNTGEFPSGFCCLAKGFIALLESSNGFQSYSNLSEIFLIDSLSYSTDGNLFIDSYGNLHDFNYRFDASNNSFAMYNLNGEYNKFVGIIVTGSNTGSGAIMNVDFFVDDEKIKTISEITKQTPLIQFEIPVAGKKTLKIVTQNSGEYGNGFVFITDGKLLY